MLTRPGPKKSEIESAQRGNLMNLGGVLAGLLFFLFSANPWCLCDAFWMESPRSVENYSWASYVVDICLAIKRAIRKDPKYSYVEYYREEVRQLSTLGTHQ